MRLTYSFAIRRSLFACSLEFKREQVFERYICISILSRTSRLNERILRAERLQIFIFHKLIELIKLTLSNIHTGGMTNVNIRIIYFSSRISYGCSCGFHMQRIGNGAILIILGTKILLEGLGILSL